MISVIIESMKKGGGVGGASSHVRNYALPSLDVKTTKAGVWGAAVVAHHVRNYASSDQWREQHEKFR